MFAAALVAMPFQGIAATLAVLICHGDSQAHATHGQGGHGHGDHQHEATHEHSGAGEDGSGTGTTPYHLCCNLTASVPPTAIVAAELPDFPVRAFVPDTLNDLYIPDQPQRPPLA